MTSRSSPLDALVRLLFLVSGLTALIYQVAWARMFVVVFGSTTQAISTVLAAFMGGLALGSLLFGRWGDRLDRPVMAYGLLEVLIGAYALAFPALLGALDGVYARIFAASGGEAGPLTVVRFLLSFGAVLVPTTLMGGTLPVLGKFVARDVREAGRRVGGLYAVNTLGAVLGTLLAAFVLLEAIGVRASIRLAASLSLAAGFAALLAGRTIRAAAPAAAEATPDEDDEPDEPEEREELAGAAEAEEAETSPRPSGAAVPALVLWGFAISGGVALALEVLYTRVLVFTVGVSAHSFGVMLAAFLTGLALGSAVFARLVDRWRRPEIGFAIVEMGIGACVLASIVVLSRIDVTHHLFGILPLGGGDLLRNRGASFAQAGLVLLPATFLMGATFPLVTRFFVRRFEDVSRAIGRLYFWNTIGAVAGSLLAGFVLVPRLGTARSFVLAASMSVAVGAMVLMGRRRTVLGPLAAAAVLAFGALGARLTDPAFFARAFNISHEGTELVYFREGVNGTVTVHSCPDWDLIAVDGIDVAGTSFMLRITQKLQAHLPVLLASGAQRVAHIGFGSGETLHVLTLHDIPRIDGIEICPDVIEGARRYFSAINRDAFLDPSVHITLMDGKNYVRLTDTMYDAILTDSVYPGVGEAGSALYTWDHFAAGREKLRPGGVLSCWMPLNVSNRDLKLVLRSFLEAFPDMAVFLGYAEATQHALLVGRKDAPIELDWRRLSRAWESPRVRDDLAQILIDSPEDLASCLLLDSDGVARLVEGVPLNTDDRPLLEFGVGRRGITNNALAGNVEEMLAVRADPVAHLTGVAESGADPARVAETVRRRVAAANRILRGHNAVALYDWGRARRHYAKALEHDPGNRVARLLAARVDRELELAESGWTRDVPAGAEQRAGASALATADGLIASGRWADAAALLREEAALRPADAQLWSRIGECALRLDRGEEAAEALEKAAAMAPDDAAIAFMLGLSREKTGNRAGARAAYERAIALNEWDDRARTNLGHLCLAEGEADRARDLFLDAYRITPGKPFAPFNVAVAWAQEGNWKETARWCEEALGKRETFVPAHVLLGDARSALGDLEGAQKAWARAIELKPDDPEARRRIAGSPPPPLRPGSGGRP